MTRWKIDHLTVSPLDVEERLAELRLLVKSPEKIPEILELSQQVSAMLRQLESYAHCRLAQDMGDRDAERLKDQCLSLMADFTSLNLDIDDLLLHSGRSFEDFPLQERCEKARKRRPLAEEKLVERLALDGFHGWSQLYDALITDIQIPLDNALLSFGQAENRVHSPDRAVRQAAFESISTAFHQRQDLFARALNHLAGFRIQNYTHQGTDVITDALEENRMQRKTLDQMWDVITKNKPLLLKYLERKAELLQVDKLAWYDLEAPLGVDQKAISFDEAKTFILRHFHSFSPELATFSQHALENQWVEAEDRAGKRPGGFCIDFPLQKETRIFMTYSGSQANVFTLAHELGHAYHAHIVFDLPEMYHHYRMNVAETASTMAEMIVIDAALNEARGEERLSLLDDRIGRTIAYLLNLHARFLFEKRFYEKRAQGIVLPDELSAMMLEAQKEAYMDSLSEYHPLFWASKMHFYFSSVPFYNFPYTFGFLLSLGIYNQIDNPDSYRALLRDTGAMTTEALVKKHLGADLTEPHFWQKALDVCLDDVTQFLSCATPRRSPVA